MFSQAPSFFHWQMCYSGDILHVATSLATATTSAVSTASCAASVFITTYVMWNIWILFLCWDLQTLEDPLFLLVLLDEPCVQFCRCVGGVWFCRLVLVGGVRFRRLILILTLVSIGLRRRIGVAGKIPFYLLSSIYSSFAKPWCENYRELNGRGHIHSLYLLQRKDISRCSLPTVRPFTVQYRLHNKSQHTPLCHNLGSFLAASNCETVLAIHLTLFNQLLAGLLLA